ncbi:hypothetical protein OAF54_01245 [bacterium]|nr:hypothetical protein [bacterium]
MSLPDVTPIVSYDGNGSTVTAYPFLFKVLDASHVKLYLDGVLSNDAITVTGVGDDAGVEVFTSVAYASGVRVTLRREVPFSQETDLVEGGRLREESLEDALDYGVMQAQQLKEELGRTIQVAPGSSGSTLPSATNSTIGQDANGDLVSRTAEEELDHLGVGVSATAAAASAAAAATSETNAATSETNAAASEAAAEASNVNASAALLDLASKSFPTTQIGKKSGEPNITSDVTINFPGGGSLTLKASERPYAEPNALNANNVDVQYLIPDIINIINGDVTDYDTNVEHGLGIGSTTVSNFTPIPGWSAKLATDGGTNLTGLADLTYYGSEQTTFTVPLPLEVKANADLAPPEDLPFVKHTVAQTLTLAQREQARENIGALGGSSAFSYVAGPYLNFPDAVANGVREGELWRDASQQVFFGAYALSNDVVSYFSQFSNSTTVEEKIRISRLLDTISTKPYLGSVKSLQLLRYGQNINTGTTRYGLLGDDFTGLTLDGAPSVLGQAWSADQYVRLGAQFAGSTTLVVWGEPKGSSQWADYQGLFGVTADVASSGHNDHGFIRIDTRAGGNLSATTRGPGGPLDEHTFSPSIQAHTLPRTVFALVRDESSSGDVSLYRDGALVETYSTTIPLHTELEDIQFGDEWRFAGSMLINDALTSSEVTSLTEEIKATVYRDQWKVLVEGDSLSRTSTNSHLDTTVPITGETHFMTVAGDDHPELDYEFLENDAVGGARTDEMEADFTTLLAGHTVPSGAENYVLRIMGGTNDINQNSSSPDTAAYYANLKSMWSEARDAGYKVVACTIPRRATTVANYSNVLAATLELNDLIKSDRTLYDALEDVDAAFIAASGGTAYADNSTYYVDETHPYEAAGQAVLAGTWFAAIDSL